MLGSCHSSYRKPCGLSRLGRERPPGREHGQGNVDLRFGNSSQERRGVVITLAKHLGHSEPGDVTVVQSLSEKPSPL